MATNREYRLERQLARRRTPEWRAAGAELAARRAAEAEEERLRTERRKAAEKEARRTAAIDSDPARTEREVTRLIRRLERAVEDARGDYPGVSDEDLFHDLWLGLRHDAPTLKVRREVELGVFGFELEG
jgi:hypothetical protein